MLYVCVGSKDGDAEKPIVEDFDEGKLDGSGEGQEGKSDEPSEAKSEGEKTDGDAGTKPAVNATKPVDKKPKVVVIKERIATTEQKTDVGALVGKRLEEAVAK